MFLDIQCCVGTCVEFLDQSTQTVDVCLVCAGSLFDGFWSSPSVKAEGQRKVQGGSDRCAFTAGHMKYDYNQDLKG